MFGMLGLWTIFLVLDDRRFGHNVYVIRSWRVDAFFLDLHCGEVERPGPVDRCVDLFEDSLSVSTL